LPGVLVADGGGEEFKEAADGIVAGAGDRIRKATPGNTSLPCESATFRNRSLRNSRLYIGGDVERLDIDQSGRVGPLGHDWLDESEVVHIERPFGGIGWATSNTEAVMVQRD
jgi:hypothetical protein